MENFDKYPNTVKITLEAFSNESKARNRYEFYAKVARKEGYLKLADFFEITANNEKEHAKLLLKLLNKIKGSMENLQDAINGEHYEHISMYPEYQKIAEEEGFKEAAELFRKLSKIELEHEKRFKKLLEELEGNKFYVSETEVFWVCRVCGNVEYGKEPPEKCPVCGHPKQYFEKKIY